MVRAIAIACIGSLGAALVVMSCLSPTELTLTVDTDIPCDRMDEIDISAGVDPAVPSAVGSCTGTGSVGSIVLVPSGDPDKQVLVQVVAGVGDVKTKDCVPPDYSGKTATGGCVVERRIVHYVKHTSLALPVTLYRRCIGVTCRQDTTCDQHGECVPATVTCSADGCRDAGSPDAACLGQAGPTQVRFDLDSGAHFCVDTTEVTNAQYDEFLAATTDASTLANLPPLGPGCDTTANAAQVARLQPGTTGPDFPVTGISPCAAEAYCFWAGKHLCGALSDGLHFDILDAGYDNVMASEWLYACTQGSAHAFPYGDVAQACACNDACRDGAAPVGTFTGCVGAGVHDQIGNVYEWENSVGVLGAGYFWPQRGGQWGSPASTNCAGPTVANENALAGDPMTGFRCCGY